MARCAGYSGMKNLVGGSRAIHAPGTSARSRRRPLPPRSASEIHETPCPSAHPIAPIVLVYPTVIKGCMIQLVQGRNTRLEIAAPWLRAGGIGGQPFWSPRMAESCGTSERWPKTAARYEGDRSPPTVYSLRLYLCGAVRLVSAIGVRAVDMRSSDPCGAVLSGSRRALFPLHLGLDRGMGVLRGIP